MHYRARKCNPERTNETSAEDGREVDWQTGVVFTHTLSLALDDVDGVLGEMRRVLRENGVPVLEEPFHITVAAVTTMAGVTPGLVDVGWPRRVRLATACRLPNSDGVVALCPHVSVADPDGSVRADQPGTARPGGATGGPTAPTPVPRELANPHRLLHDRLHDAGVVTFNYYGPQCWNPHVTMGYRVPERLRDRAVAMLSGGVPVDVAVRGVAVWRVDDGEMALLHEL